MFISEKLVFIELHKTGCTHIRNLLNELLPGEFVGKHNQVSLDVSKKERFFLGSIRCPWEWYVSLWAFGCDKKGAVFNKVTAQDQLRGLEKWTRVYQSSEDVSAFREWLFMMNDKQYWHDFGEGFGGSPISQFAGLLTYRYMTLFCCKDHESVNLAKLDSFDSLAEYARERCFVDHFIRNEKLEADFFKVLELIGINVSIEKRAELSLRPKTNLSSRAHDAHYYYDSDTEKLVFERERFIVEKFGYVKPSLRLNAQ